MRNSKKERAEIPIHMETRPPMPAMNPSTEPNRGSKSRTVWTKVEYRMDTNAAVFCITSIRRFSSSVAVSWGKEGWKIEKDLQVLACTHDDVLEWPSIFSGDDFVCGASSNE